MGCGGSKLDDLQAVALCRDRSRLLADALRARRALADAHAAYARSLRSLGPALRRFLDARGPAPAPAPALPLPPRRKADPSPPPPSPPLRTRPHISSPDSGSEPVGATYTSISYARARPAARSVAFQQHPESSEPVLHFGGPYPTESSSFYSDSYRYPYPYTYPPSFSGYGGMNGFFESAPPPPAEPSLRESPSSRAPPPPMPSPPRASAWDFLNPFESYYSYSTPYSATYTPSQSSREVREAEGIPDLEEDEDDVDAVVKEAYDKHHNFVNGNARKSSATCSTSDDEDDELSSTSADPRCEMASAGPTGHGAGFNAPMVDKNVDASVVPQRRERGRNVVAPRKYGSVSVVVDEIEAQFNRSSESLEEVSNILGVRHRRHYRSGTTKVTHPSNLSNEEFSDFEEDKQRSCRSLSKTLQKLYMWEKKLHEEVRAEEKMRLLHVKYCKRLKHLDQKGAEANKIDATRNMIWKLSTRIRIAIQVVDSISNRINKLRDEELCPQICELIQGFMKMWCVMLECHQSQCQALSEAKIPDSMLDGENFSDALMEATKLLAFEMLDWVGNFSAWINAQRSYIRVLNSWLLKCIHYQPEETPDGIVPFSPGRLGAPPVFVICNYWSQSIDRISEMEVVDSMQSFAANVLQFWQRYHLQRRQRVMANGDMNTALKMLEKEEQEMRRELDSQSKKLVLVSGHSDLSLHWEDVHRSHKVEVNKLQFSLSQIFAAMENFTASSMKLYEEVHKRSEEERLFRGNTKVP